MNWKLKAHALAVASRVPGGRTAYLRFQDRQASRMNDADEMLGRALDLLATFRDAGGDPAGSDCLEIGTGWCPWVPLLLVLKGARSVLTMDVNPYLSQATAVGTTRALLERTARVSDGIGLPVADIVKRLEAPARATTLDAWLNGLGVTYRLGDVTRASLAQAGFDLVVSSNVLEHVPPDALEAIHAESVRLLRPGGCVVHRFNPQDHYSTFDRSITGANFLQFSSNEWHWLGGSGISYHNRLRCPQHQALVERTGLSVRLSRTRPDLAAQRAIESGALKVHPDFAGMSLADLTDEYMWIVAEKPASARA
jgi:SAM-dependent methyltransferase